MKKSSIAVISGTGVTEHFKLGRRLKVKTRYGTAEVYLDQARDYFILPRHGPKHNIPPHLINYRANILSLHQLGVRHIIATNAVGSIRKDFPPGSIGTVAQFIDFTKGREPTIFQDGVVHADMSHPYSERLNDLISKAAKQLGINLLGGLVYACMEGPRYETAAEIEMLRRLGADVVGMTGVPEVVYANELSIEYASVVVSTNYAAGMQGKLSHEEVVGVMRRIGGAVTKVIDTAFEMLERR